MKPLYRQNSHYIGKSTTSRLTYRLVTKSVPCRLDSTYRLENLACDNGMIILRIRGEREKTRAFHYLYAAVANSFIPDWFYSETGLMVVP
jgi:hypothetical protein